MGLGSGVVRLRRDVFGARSFVVSNGAMLPHIRGRLVVFVLGAIAVGTGAAAVGIRSVSAADLQRALLVPFITALFLGGVISAVQRQWYARTYWIAFVVATFVAALDTNRAHVEMFLVSFAWMVYWIQTQSTGDSIRASVPASSLARPACPSIPGSAG